MFNLRRSLRKRYIGSLGILMAIVALTLFGTAAFGPAPVDANNQVITLNINGAEVGMANHAVSGPVRNMPRDNGHSEKPKHERPPLPIPLGPQNSNQSDPVVQSSPGPLVPTTAGL